MRLQLLGAFHLEAGDGRAISLPTKKTKALLAYLACNTGEALTRSKLSSLFWEESAPAQARDALRQTLSALRKALAPEHGQSLSTQGDTVKFDPQGIQVDILDFQRLLATGDPADLSAAAQLYRGAFLDGFDIQAPEFEIWMNSVRHQHNERVITSLRKLLKYYISVDDVDRALTIGSRLISHDPMREGVYRDLMELHLRQGRYIDALRAYEQCVAVLRKELGIEPDAQTRALHQQILERRRRRHEGKEEEKHNRVRKDLKRNAGWAAGHPPPLAFSPGRLERRQMTVVACALPGLNQLADAVDLDELRPAVKDYRERLTAAAARFDGVPANFFGEIMTFYFGYPLAHEHAAEQAVRAGLALIEEASQLDPVLLEAGQLSVGVASSPVVAGDFASGNDESGPGLLGEAPGLALALLAAAGPGDLAISRRTRNMIGDLFRCEPLPSGMGANGGRHGWRVVGENTARSRFDAFRRSHATSFVGREAEIEKILGHWRQGRAGEGQVVLVSGEPGIGKSRLVRGFLDLIRGEPFFRQLFQCSPFHSNSALYPVIRHLQHVARFGLADSPAQKVEKLQGMLERVSLNRLENVRLFATLLSIPAADLFPPIELPPAQLRRKILDALLNQIEGLANQLPLLMLVEDAHWMDASSAELLDLMSDRARRLSMMVVITSRPGFEPAWSGLDHVHRLELGSLDQRNVRTLIDQISGDSKLPRKIVDQIVDKSDGVPLFAEELAGSVLDSRRRLREGRAARGEEGGAPRGSGQTALTVPATLRDSLLARLDRLDSAKEIAQIGAAIGREFSGELVHAVSDRPAAELESALERLVDSGLVNKVGSTSRRSYAFRHALLRDAAYETLGKGERQRLHALIARAMSEHFPSEALSHPEIKARHYTSAGMTREALGLWLKAGDLARARSANREAIAHLREGLSLVESAADLEEAERRRWKRLLLMSIGPAVMVLRGYTTPESEKIFEEARQLIDAATPVGERILILRGLWSVEFARSNMGRALELANETLALAAASGEALFQAHCMLGQTLTSMGEFRQALPHLQFIIDGFKTGKLNGADPHFTPTDYPWALVYMARTLWGLGLTVQSAATADEAVVRARAGHDSAATAVAYLGQMFLAVHGAQLQEAMASAREAILHGEQQEMALFGAWIQFGQGALLARQGKFSAGVEVMRSAVEACDAMQGGQFRPFQLGCIAEAHLKLGDLDSALASVEEALAQAERSGEKQSAVSLHRLRGEILFAQARPREALQEMEAALKTARSQGARLEELRVLLVLARLPQAPVDSARAMTALRTVYDTFQEGFDHPYLVAAREALTAYECRT